MAEDLPCFDLGVQFLNVEKDEESGGQLHKISTLNNNARFVHLSEEDRYQLLADAGAKATKSSRLDLGCKSF